MPVPIPSTSRQRRHHRLWPLLFLPIAGLLAGLYLGREGIRFPFAVGRFDPVTSAMLGLVAGCGAMVISAAAVLAYRIAKMRFTIGAILITIAVVAVLLGWARSNLF